MKSKAGIARKYGGLHFDNLRTYQLLLPFLLLAAYQAQNWKWQFFVEAGHSNWLILGRS